MGDVTSPCFFPQKDYDPIPRELHFDVQCRDGTALRCCRLEGRSKQAPSLIYFHGNGELVSKLCCASPEGCSLPFLRDILDSLLQRGALQQCLLVEYRGYGANPGIPTMAGTLADAEDAFTALGVGQEEVIVMGRSIGTIPSLHLARLHPRLRALVIESGMHQPLEFVAERIGMQPEELRGIVAGEGLARLGCMAGYTGPTLLLHCEDDEVFPHSGRARFTAASDSRHTVSNAEQDWGSIVQHPQYQEHAQEAAQPCTLHTFQRPGAANVMLCEFEVGGHNFIWPMNWKVYSAMLLMLCASADPNLEEHAQQEKLPSTNVLDDESWWEELQVFRERERAEASVAGQGRCCVS